MINYNFFFSLSFDGIVLVTQNYDTLPSKLDCMKAPLQDYSSVSLSPGHASKFLIWFIPNRCYRVC